MDEKRDTRRRAFAYYMSFVLLCLAVAIGATASRAAISQTSSWPMAGERSSLMAAPAGGAENAGVGQFAIPPSIAQIEVPRAGTVNVGRSLKNDVSPPLRSIKPIAPDPNAAPREAPENEEVPFRSSQPPARDTVVQRSFGAGAFAPLAMPTPIANFEGLGSKYFLSPPDTNGDVGRDHYVQMVNVTFQIFSKSGVSLYGPADNNTLWYGFGGPCETRNDGDPIVLYDPIADRWMLSQFITASPYGQCFAISTSGDPLGSYYRYFFQLSNSVFYDYNKFGVWPDAYYMGTNNFQFNYVGSSAIAFERANMLAGQPARYIEHIRTQGLMLPADLDGPTQPPAGSPGIFLELPGDSTLNLLRMQVNWTANPPTSVLTGPISLGPAPFDRTLCFASRGACVPQPGGAPALETLSDRLMHRLAYRNFGTHESLVANHTVDSNGSGLAGIRWYEIRNPNGTPFIYQQGTYAPAGGVHRWWAP